MCRRCFCQDCGEEMIHRDNRHGYEASSALNQIIHREGPRELTVGDVDTYALKKLGNRACVRLLEHKQPGQSLKLMQSTALSYLDLCLRHAASHSLFGITEGSGVFVVRGQLTGSDHGRRKVDFDGAQTIETLQGQAVLKPKNRRELWDWVCCNTPYRLRNEQW